MDYSKILNLPKTDFPMKANLKVREPEMLSAWNEKGIERLIREKRGLCQKFRRTNLESQKAFGKSATGSWSKPKSDKKQSAREIWARIF